MQTKVLCLAFAALVLHADVVGASAGARREREGTAFVIPIHGDVNKSLLYVVRRTVSQAERAGASLIIFEMDTYGGRLDCAEEIIHRLVGIQTPTYTYVNRHALSAGAFIAMATDRIYMADGARIGAAAPVAVTPFLTPVDMPTNITAKVTSDLRALLRWVAEKKGYDLRVIEAMINPEAGCTIGGQIICPPGQLLTLHNVQAEQMVTEDGRSRPLLSSGTIQNVEELLQRIGKSAYIIKRLAITPAERLARFVDALAVQGILLGLGLLLLWIEFKTPGFGLPGTTGLVLLAIWFWGHHIAGLAGFEEIALFLIGLILLGLEVFVFPGFGAVGLTGVAFMLTALMMAMVEHYPSQPWYRIPDIHVQHVLLNMGVAIVLSFVLGAILARYLPSSPVFRRVGLIRTLAQAEGYQAAPDTTSLVGLTGVAVTPLRPSGIAHVADRRLDVVSRGEFIEKGERIVIAETHGSHIVVERAGDSPA